MRFSICCAYFQGTVSPEEFNRGVASLRQQTFPDYEIIIYHDGPLIDKSICQFPVQETSVVAADWGNTPREHAMQAARGEYIIHFNIDNYLYPNALERINEEICRPARLFHTETNEIVDKNDIIIFPIIYRGWQINSNQVYLCKDHPEIYTIFTGTPVCVGHIDAMQLVMRRELWERHGWWYDKSKNGDGLMYMAFAQQYGYRTVCPILGEHW